MNTTKHLYSTVVLMCLSVQGLLYGQFYWTDTISITRFLGSFPLVGACEPNSSILLNAKEAFHPNDDTATTLNCVLLSSNGKILSLKNFGSCSRKYQPLLSTYGVNTFTTAFRRVLSSDTVVVQTFDSQLQGIWSLAVRDSGEIAPLKIIGNQETGLTLLTGNSSFYLSMVRRINNSGLMDWEMLLNDTHNQTIVLTSDNTFLHCGVAREFIIIRRYSSASSLISTIQTDNFGKNGYTSGPSVCYADTSFGSDGIIMIKEDFCLGGGVCGGGSSWYSIRRTDAGIKSIFRSQQDRIVCGVKPIAGSKLLIYGSCYVVNGQGKTAGMFFDIFNRNNLSVKEKTFFKEHDFRNVELQYLPDTTFLLTATTGRDTVHFFKFNGEGELLWQHRRSVFIPDTCHIETGKLIQWSSGDCGLFIGTLTKNEKLHSLHYWYIVSDQYARKGALFTHDLPQPTLSTPPNYTLVQAPAGMQLIDNSRIIWTVNFDSLATMRIVIAAASATRTDTLSFVLFVNGKKTITMIQKKSIQSTHGGMNDISYNRTARTIRILNVSAPIKVSIFDVRGRRIMYQKYVKADQPDGDFTLELNTVGVTCGYYLLLCEDANRTLLQKLVAF